MSRTVTAIFDSFYLAKQAFRELRENGYPNDLIYVFEQSHYGTPSETMRTQKNVRIKSEIISGDVSTGARIGAGIGSALGIAGGLLLSLGLLQAPGMAAAVDAAQALFSTLSGAGAGLVGGAILGSLLGGSIGLGISEEEAQQYARNVRSGRVIIAVLSDWYTVDQTKEILSQFNPLDLREENVQPLFSKNKANNLSGLPAYSHSREEGQSQ